jgi:hypothetical protein
MAILDNLSGVEVTIFCNSTEVAEYPDDGDEVRLGWKHKTISNYIESISDTEFFIQLRVGPPYKFDCDNLSFNIIFDGDEAAADGYVCHPADFVNGVWEDEANGREVPTNRGRMLRKYKFAKIETSTYSLFRRSYR